MTIPGWPTPKCYPTSAARDRTKGRGKAGVELYAKPGDTARALHRSAEA